MPTRARVVPHDDGETQRAVEARVRDAVSADSTVDIDEVVRVVVGTVMRVRRAAAVRIVESAAAHADATRAFLAARVPIQEGVNTRDGREGVIADDGHRP